MNRIFSLFLFQAAILLNCQNGKNSEIQDNNTQKESIKLIEITSPFSNSNFKLGDKINFTFKKSVDSLNIDSIRLFAENKYITTLSENVFQYTWNSTDSKLGRISIQATAYSSKTNSYSTSMVLQILSDTKPVEYGYKIIKVYPHSRNSYTQGLIYENGYFYESCGEYGESALKKTKLETGEIVMSNNMEQNYFGEGLAQYDGKLYQITYREHTCFIYDKKTFENKGKISYDFAEGWGLEFNGKNFLFTDGGSNIYFLEPQNFTMVDKIEVCDNEDAISNINELEIIKGLLYANVYTKNIVLIINMKNGKVEGKIDFTGILPASDYANTTDVLNGIAWNPENGHLFITGKKWPKLFEVSIYKK
jgi:glutamine cyclotransferase